MFGLGDMVFLRSQGAGQKSMILVLGHSSRI